MRHVPTKCLQHTATHYNALQLNDLSQGMSAKVTHSSLDIGCNVQQHTATRTNTPASPRECLQRTATHCNVAVHLLLQQNVCKSHTYLSGCTLQHAATRCNTLQRTATHRTRCNIPASPISKGMSAKVAHSSLDKDCNILQHTATRCNTPASPRECLQKSCIALLI